LVLGEAHFDTMPGRAPSPSWLTIPQRGLYTGVMVLGAVGTGKTSACMYPYVEQLLRWRADDPERKIGGLVLEVKGDFCGQVRTILTQAGRERDYVEIGLDGGFCYNPLHNDLDPYAVAYAIATLLNNLFGKSKEPFWQQAYTDLLKFVILLRRITEGYTTLSEVYRYILEDRQIDEDIKRVKNSLAEAPEVIVISTGDYREHCGPPAPWINWFAEGAEEMAHEYNSDLETYLDARQVMGGRRAVTRSRRWNAGISTAGAVSTTACGRRSPKASWSFSRSSTITPPYIAHSVRRARRTCRNQSQASPSRCHRSTSCSRPVTCSR
jgi:hypothetical protein